MKLNINYSYNIRGWNVIIDDDNTTSKTTCSEKDKLTLPTSAETTDTKSVSNSPDM